MFETVDHRQQHHGDHPRQQHRHNYARHAVENAGQSEDEQPDDRSIVVIIAVLTVPLTYWVGRTSELGAPPSARRHIQSGRVGLAD